MINDKRTKLLCAASFILGASITLLAVATAAIWFAHHYRFGYLQRINGEIHADIAHNEKASACGLIEPIEIPLANPSGALPDEKERLQAPRWVFENFSESSLTRFLSACDLRQVEKRTLLDKRTWTVGSNNVVILPPEQLVWSMSHKARQQIYSMLARSSQNYSQCFPFRFPVEGFEAKFKECGLSVEQVEKIKRLTYTNGGFLCFTDLQAVQKILQPDDFKDLVCSLYAVPTYLLRLRVTPDADVDALVKYWGRGGREKFVAPLLTALSHAPGGGAINISYFLPPFARLRLYTYPEAWKDPTAPRQDCFFTAMNFFNETPDTNFFNSAYSKRVLDTEYVAVKDEPSFGDIVTLFSAAGDPVHTCVYIADDFVFTKNGINAEQPWVIMRMPDMLMIYFAQETSGKMLVLRRKDLS
jgi:hypothetical protein